MKKFLLSISACFLAMSGAHAADLPQYPPPPPVIYTPIFTWTGSYVGLNAGYGWNDNNADYRFFSRTTAALPEFPMGFLATGAENDQSGFVGGVQAGYNFQFNQFVVGVEADINYLGGSKTLDFAAIDTDGDRSFAAHNTAGVDWLGTLRARVGYAADRFLIYATGGVAFGNGESTTNFAYFSNTSFTPPATLAWSGARSDTQFGWTAGAGVEYAFTNNWIAKLEYLYFDLGDTTYALRDLNRAGFTANISQQFTGNIVRAGVNYKF